MRAAHFIPVVLVAIIPLSGTATGQATRSSPTIRFAAGGALTYGNLSGGDFSGSKGAAGFDVSAGVARGPLSLLLGYDRTNHGHDDASGDFVVSNIYVEPRFAFARSSARLTPYLAARLGRAMATFEGSPGFSQDASGYIVGLGGGILWPLRGAFSADGAVHLARESHDYSYDSPGGDYSSAEKGNRISLRVGIRWAPNK